MKQNSFLITGLGLNMIQMQKIVQMMREKEGLILICGPEEKPNSEVLAEFFQLLRQKRRENKNQDVIIIKEICNTRIAGTAVREALAGHLVLSLLRMDDPVDIFRRIVDFGIEPPVLASVLKGVIIETVISKNRNTTVLVDVVSVREKRKNMMVPKYTPEYLNESFLHCTNVISEVLKSVKCLPPPVYRNCGKSVMEGLYKKNSRQEAEKKNCRKKTEKRETQSTAGKFCRPFLIPDNILRMKRSHLFFGRNRYFIRIGKSGSDTEFDIRYQSIPGKIIR
ncbi:MAG: GspE family protein [Treponema sp.]|nr:GspE family protein [Treponema sp.]